MATTRITDVRTVGIPVTDQDRALEFYTGRLGFETRMDATMGEGMRWIEVAPPGASTSIALVAAGEGEPVGVDTGIRFTTADTDADHAAMRAADVDADDVMRWEGVPEMFTFRDQDANTLYIVEEVRP